jgi:retron-type reverse transcriptase
MRSDELQLHCVKSRFASALSFGHFVSRLSGTLKFTRGVTPVHIDSDNHTVIFENWDLHYVSTVGLLSATDEALCHIEQTSVPFIRDTHQLAHLLGLRHHVFFDLLRHVNECYRPITLKKKNGNVRRIHAPYALLRWTQREILHRILDKLPVSPYATAYRRGKRLTDNAAPHCGKRYLLKLDLKDFFPSIRFDQVLAAAFPRRLFPKHIGTMLTTLCCREDVLPQGAPTSPALSNLVMKHFDDVMGGYCERQGLAYTRYCDDITVSGNKPLYTAYEKACRLLGEMGFTVNDAKTRFVTRASRQSVTGLVVNETLHVPREYRRALRQELHYVFTYGVDDAIRHRNDPAFFDEWGDPAVLKYLDHLEGRARYILGIEPHNTYFREACDKLARTREYADQYDYVPYFEPHYTT